MALDVHWREAMERIVRPSERAQIEVVDEMMGELLERDSSLPWALVRSVLVERLTAGSPVVSEILNDLEAALVDEGCEPVSYVS